MLRVGKRSEVAHSFHRVPNPYIVFRDTYLENGEVITAAPTSKISSSPLLYVSGCCNLEGSRPLTRVREYSSVLGLHQHVYRSLTSPLISFFTASDALECPHATSASES